MLTPKTRGALAALALLVSTALFVVFMFKKLKVAADEVATVLTDPCLEEDYAEKNYGTCCANMGYKKPGHGEICKIVGPRVKALGPRVKRKRKKRPFFFF